MISATCSFCRVDISPWRPPPRLGAYDKFDQCGCEAFPLGNGGDGSANVRPPRPMNDGALFDDHADSAPGTTAHPKR